MLKYVSLISRRFGRSKKISTIIAFLFIMISISSLGFITFKKSSTQQNYLKEISVVIFNNAEEAAEDSLKDTGIKKIHAIYLDAHPSSSHFATVKSKTGGIDRKILDMINTSFVLFSGQERYHIPSNIPKLPKKHMVVGYIFSQCYKDGFALKLPDRIDGCAITKQTLKRFIDFSLQTLGNGYDESEGFRIFMEFHSLHLLMFPCGYKTGSLQAWEDISVVDNEIETELKPWGKLEKIPEVWKIYK